MARALLLGVQRPVTAIRLRKRREKPSQIFLQIELKSKLEHNLRETLGLRVNVAIVPPGSVPRTEVGKAVRVRRWSAGEPPVPGLVPTPG